jgi:hypothetical protein
VKVDTVKPQRGNWTLVPASKFPIRSGFQLPDPSDVKLLRMSA